MKLRYHAGLAMLFIAATLWLAPTASAWQNGARTVRSAGGVSVQQWVLQQAVPVAAAAGADWVDLATALDVVGDPDTVLHDYGNHSFDRWGPSRGGQAPQKAALYFGLLRQAVKAGDTETASRLLGMLTHYYSDVCNPFHTDDWRGETHIHRRFDLRVMALLNAGTGNRVKLAAAGVPVVATGTDIASYTVRTATRAHRDYARLTRAIRSVGFGRVAGRIAAKSLRRAVAGVAGMIVAASSNDPIATRTPVSAATTTPTLLSKNAPAVASSQDAVYRPAGCADDGDRRSWWAASDASYPQWWQVDLGGDYRLTNITIDWLKGKDRSYRFTVKVSSNGSDWTTAVDESARTSFGRSTDKMSTESARYVRVTTVGYGVSDKIASDAASTSCAAILECSVYGVSASVPATTPTATPTPTATLTFSPSPTPTPTPTHTATAGGVVNVRSYGAKGDGSTDDLTAIKKAMAAAVAAGDGSTVWFPTGDYVCSSRLTWPSGVDMTGDGISKSKLRCAVIFGSDTTVGGAEYAGITLGYPTASTSFYFTSGSSNTTFSHVRFRGKSGYLWDLEDYTSNWSDAVVRDHCNVHDIVWDCCEFESQGGTSATDEFSIWWDCRKGGGNVYNLTWTDCTFGAKRPDGTYGVGRVGLLIQPSPPEHAADGPRPTLGSKAGVVMTGFAWAQDTHGSGQAAVGGSGGYGFLLDGCRFVGGTASLSSFDLCDNERSWVITTYNLAFYGTTTQAQRDQAPDRVSTKGVTVTDCWFGGKWTNEYGRDLVSSGNTTNGGLTAYNATAECKAHDAELYGQ